MVIGGIGIPPRHPIITARCLGGEGGGRPPQQHPQTNSTKIKELSEHRWVILEGFWQTRSVGCWKGFSRDDAPSGLGGLCVRDGSILYKRFKEKWLMPTTWPEQRI